MKILHTVQGYYPDSGGSEEVVRRLSEYMVKWGHQVTVATRTSRRRDFDTLNGVRIAGFDCSGNSVEGIKGDALGYLEFVKNGDFDIMMNYAAQTWSTDLVLEHLPDLRSKNVFVPCGYSNLKNPRYAEYYKMMPAALRDYDSVVYLSPNYQDTRFGEEHGLQNGIVIPNGADLDEFSGHQKGEFKRKRGLRGDFLMLNVSNHSFLKNHDFFWKCVDRLKGSNVSSALIGNAFHPFPKKILTECYSRCRIKGMSRTVPVLEGLARQEVVEAYLDADVFVFGSLVECSPLVMFEAFASKTLFITTDCGNVKDYADIVSVVRNENEAVSVLLDYRNNPSGYREKVEKGYEYFRDRLNWESISRSYESVYLRLFSG